MSMTIFEIEEVLIDGSKEDVLRAVQKTGR